jgi:hypothetical protein
MREGREFWEGHLAFWPVAFLSVIKGQQNSLKNLSRELEIIYVRPLEESRWSRSIVTIKAIKFESICIPL